MKAALVISQLDNVATALEALAPGQRLEIGGVAVTVAEPIPSGHKVALAPIPSGAPVIKYGSPIGLASADIAPGNHVHTHNLSSSRGRGDLETGSGGQGPGAGGQGPAFAADAPSRFGEAGLGGEARLAEPPDPLNGAGGSPSPPSGRHP
jgi:altronate dehydratase small subunit